MKTASPHRNHSEVFHPCISYVRRATAGTIIALGLVLLPPRRGKAEEFLDSKVLYYQESGNRMKVLAPAFLFQRETEDGWTIKIDGIYNSISGATPTGAPPRRKTTTTTVYTPAPAASHGGDDGEGEGGDDKTATSSVSVGGSSPAKSSASSYSAMTGATPTSSPPSTPSSTSSTSTSSGSDELPTSEVTDHRLGLNIGASKRFGNQTPSIQLSFSTEQDYRSAGISLTDALDFNKKNTTFTLGGAYTSDEITPSNDQEGGSRRTADAILGLTQILSPTTLLTVNVSAGRSEGYMTDPYKVVEMNGILVPEKRPDNKNKTIFYVGLTQFIAPADASLQLEFRHYADSFGINAETLAAAWFQKLSPQFTLSPSLRYYDQTAADFYAVRFSGSPEFYSSDYRVSAMRTLGYGIKLIWSPTHRFSMDIGYERYDMKGTDGETSQEMYPSANLLLLGARVTL